MQGRTKAIVLYGVLALLVVGVVMLSQPQTRAMARWAWARLAGGATVAERLEQYGPAARSRLAPHFEAAALPYPPVDVVLVGIKQDRVLEVWARGSSDQGQRLVVTYPILGASGELGPKLRQGDRQVPEGLYRIESLHPNSRYHLALRVNYPNAYDRQQGEADGRTQLGSDIMIHGGTASIGCLAMGDDVAEELFVLAADVGVESVSLVLTPVNFRQSDLPTDLPALPDWVPTLYQTIRDELTAMNTAVAPGAIGGVDVASPGGDSSHVHD